MGRMTDCHDGIDLAAHSTSHGRPSLSVDISGAMKRPVAVVTSPFNPMFNRAWRATPAIETSTCPQCHRDAAFLVWREGTWLCSVCIAPAGTSGEGAGTLGG